MVDEVFERFVTRYVLPLLFLVVAVVCLVMLGAAVVEGTWVAAPVHALAAVFLVFLADVCRRKVPPIERAVRRDLWAHSLNRVRHLDRAA
jgi:hypothetical protein